MGKTITKFVAMLVRLIIITWLGSVTPAMAASWSGLYLGHSHDSEFFTLQLVETKEGEVVGRLRLMEVSIDGLSANLDVSMTGAVERGRIVGRIERTWIQGGTIPFSGIKTNSGIQISGGDGLQLSLVAASEKEQEALIFELYSHAQNAADVARAAKADKDAERLAKSAISDINNALSQAEELERRGVELMKRLQKVSPHLEATIAMQEKYMAHAKTLRDSYARMQVSYEMSQLLFNDIFSVQNEISTSKFRATSALSSGAHSLSKAKTHCSQRGSDTLHQEEFTFKCPMVQKASVAVNKLTTQLDELFKSTDAAITAAEKRSEALIAEVDAFK